MGLKTETNAAVIQFDSSEKVYLDFNGTTPLDADVVASIAQTLKANWHNPSSQSVLGKHAKWLVNEARRSIASMLNVADSPSDIFFLSGGTEANNLVFHSVLKEFEKICKARQIANTLPHIITTNIEHDSVKLVAEYYEANGLAEVTYVKASIDGCVSVGDMITAIKPNTILITIMLANNETGVIQPVKELTDRIAKLGYNKNDNDTARPFPLYVHTDAAQAIGKIKVNVVELDVHYLTVVGHKFYGPKIGALYARNCLGSSSRMMQCPIIHMFQGASQESGLRPGTENVPMIVGLGKAAELVKRNVDEYGVRMRDTRDYLEKRLREEFGSENLCFNGLSVKSERLPNTCNVSFISNEAYKGYYILQRVKHLEASTGACCHSGECKPSKILLAMGVDKSVASNAVRLSVGRDTTKEQIDVVVEDLKQALQGMTPSSFN